MAKAARPKRASRKPRRAPRGQSWKKRGRRRAALEENQLMELMHGFEGKPAENHMAFTKSGCFLQMFPSTNPLKNQLTK